MNTKKLLYTGAWNSVLLLVCLILTALSATPSIFNLIASTLAIVLTIIDCVVLFKAAKETK